MSESIAQRTNALAVPSDAAQIRALVEAIRQDLGLPLTASATFDPAASADGAGETTTVTVTGAKLGDFAVASFSLDLQGYTVTAYVSADDTVSVRFQNESAAAPNIASGTLRVKVFPATANLVV